MSALGREWELESAVQPLHSDSAEGEEERDAQQVSRGSAGKCQRAMQGETGLEVQPGKENRRSRKAELVMYTTVPFRPRESELPCHSLIYPSTRRGENPHSFHGERLTNSAERLYFLRGRKAA